MIFSTEELQALQKRWLDEPCIDSNPLTKGEITLIIQSAIEDRISDENWEAASMESYRQGCASAEERVEYLGSVLCGIAFDLARGAGKWLRIVEDGEDIANMINLQLVRWGTHVAVQGTALQTMASNQAGMIAALIEHGLVDPDTFQRQVEAIEASL